MEKKKKEQNDQELCDNVKRCNILKIGIREGEERGRAEKKFEVTVVENIPKSMAYIRP